MTCTCGHADAYIPSACNFPHCFQCGDSLAEAHDHWVAPFEMRVEQYGIDPNAVGSVISGTLRLQDLIPRFLEVLDDRAPEKAERFAAEIPDAAGGNDTHPFWASDLAMELYLELIDALNEAAPPGFYFGTHPGDGADFGFWATDYWST